MVGILRAMRLAVPLAAAALLLASCQKFAEVRTEKYPAAGCSSIAVGNLNGSINIHPVDGDSIVIGASIEAWGRDALEGVQVSFSSGPTARIQVIAPQGFLNAATVDLDLGIPASLVIGDVQTTNGDVNSFGMNHNGVLLTTNGDIDASGCSGTASLVTTNGDVSASGGSLVVFDALSTNGEVAVETAGLSANGSAYETTNGDVGVFLPARMDCVVDLSTTNGEVTVSGIQYAGELDDKGGRVILGQGGPVVTIGTTNGDVNLTGRTAP
jgi:DUF4097 and DUF4098 domain-containing protein YvlB